ncbi:MAG TPA: amidohydrolase family protein [Reyranella sp.]|nr:amidohydrolase family protein [Reyranella sp.]
MAFKRIAVEEAFVTAAVADGWVDVLKRLDVEPGFAKMGGALTAPTKAAKQLHEAMIEIGPGRIAHMDAVGIDMQVLSLTAPGVQVFDADIAARLAIEANDVLAEAVRKYPTRFGGLAAFAPQDPEAAAREIERAAGKLGLNGLIVNSHTRGEYLDLPKYTPIFEAAQAADLPIYLHPREPGPPMVGPFLDYGLYFAIWGFAADTALHALRLILSGTFDRFPRLKIVLGHMGEGLPFWLQRLDNRYKAQVAVGASDKLARLPSEYFLDNFVITTAGVTFMPALRLSLDVLGSERILFAADYPYEDDAEAVRFLDGADITEAERRQIYETNAVRLFKLKI